jgi:hypothetical protein
MNKLATLTFASLASVAFAGQPVVSYDSKKTVIPAEPCFAETELQLDIYGAYAGTYGDAHEDGWGGGVGINYYFTRNWGVGVDGTVTDGEGQELWHVLGHVLLRFPIETDGGLCLAPYIKAGGGYQVNGSGDWAYGAGAGIEFRLSQRVGIFGEGGYYWSADDENDFAQAKAGVRFIF